MEPGPKRHQQPCPANRSAPQAASRRAGPHQHPDLPRVPAGRCGRHHPPTLGAAPLSHQLPTTGSSQHRCHRGPPATTGQNEAEESRRHCQENRAAPSVPAAEHVYGDPPERTLQRCRGSRPLPAPPSPAVSMLSSSAPGLSAMLSPRRGWLPRACSCSCFCSCPLASPHKPCPASPAWGWLPTRWVCAAPRACTAAGKANVSDSNCSRRRLPLPRYPHSPG